MKASVKLHYSKKLVKEFDPPSSLIGHPHTYEENVVMGVENLRSFYFIQLKYKCIITKPYTHVKKQNITLYYCTGKDYSGHKQGCWIRTSGKLFLYKSTNARAIKCRVVPSKDIPSTIFPTAVLLMDSHTYFGSHLYDNVLSLDQLDSDIPQLGVRTKLWRKNC